ncbi:sarcosine oxidase subunit beta family protein [Amylibacter sp. SFDW26]|uniref:sarcosine oxidase subunit beta family protein n=1 Tax=Amylibacter sp. SFDW26 TaxID=2652722 RepID=UPI001261DA3F|nr:sarcosine oxidase subunit beta family protein [Amylibacter sp. SFDW26]KAB7613517.1 sarcosine oxidase subunit beta family protein [Amylibacter sp. SFDW26]
MTRHYSAFNLLREGLRGHKGWGRAWRSPEPKSAYDIVIIGGGGHGLATAHYLVRNHGITNVAVLEKGWLGGGNTGRNTTVIRSNYFYPESAALYDMSVQLYEGLSRELNYNVMFSQRGMLVTAHSEPDMEMAARQLNAMRLNGVDAELLDADQVRRFEPALNFGPNMRFPIHGGILQKRAGTGRHDAVAWGFARSADAGGVDIIQNCEVNEFIVEAGRCVGVNTSKGEIRADAIGAAVAGHSSALMKKAGVELPINSYALQAFVSEPLKPVLNSVVLCPPFGTYVSQSDKGGLVIGGGLDRVPSYGQRGNMPVQEAVLSGLAEMMPSLSKVKLLRHWAGIVDVTPDSSPIIGPSGLDGLYLDCGWGTGGFKAIPVGGWLLAHLLATGKHHEISRPFDRNRFVSGYLIDEGAASGIAH